MRQTYPATEARAVGFVIKEQTPKPDSSSAHNEQGWALLGLIMALGIIAIVMASAVVPNVMTSVRREKEAEMIYRGEQMAKAIARYYNSGRLSGIQLENRPPYGYLTELGKLRNGVTIGVTEIKFVRGSAMIDPMTNEEWEPVYFRDPRIKNFLNNYAAATGIVITDQYWWLAGPPERLQLNPNLTVGVPNPQGSPAGSTRPGQVTPPRVNPEQPKDEDDDDDEDEDDDSNDPLRHLLEGNQPIIGVAPRLKGRAIRNYYGLENYQDWIFLYVPDPRMINQPGRLPIPNQPNNNRPRVMQ